MSSEVSVAIIQRGSEFLFQRRKKEPYKDHLGLLGGKIESGENRDQAVRREIKEESSLNVIAAKFLGTVIETLHTNGVTKQVDLLIYKAEVEGESKHNIDEGEVVWVPIDTMEKRKTEFIPTDWLIVRRVLDGVFSSFQLSVFEKDNQYSIIANYEKK